ncbi:uncharacterized protein BYT42DRAFT_505367 [Radiomyces spectabilis]|uniref:uncharacterized protein n=1 Tax=Radiomyces spectabilis TaxID=64574 RepID=UPI00221F4CBF|nr:uncharacterized protein BYT42DRAFT_505367 [Radiomyces spectabilis]KAI8365953.1 hypothetical protein BYT42DRAFT_505367 [Radiomyces spectabilis]
MTTDKSSSVVLQTGFPSNDNLTARSVLPNQAAAVAFSPKPDVSAMGESWWDRLFHYNHVHLDNVQLAVRGTKAQLSICSSTHDTLWQNIPDSLNCVATTTAVADIEDDEEPFNVLEWHPTDVVVLRKRQLYWLVVEPVDGEVLEWVFAQPGVNQWGSAYQTKDTWQLDSEDGPVPCAIVAVVAH